MNAVCGLDPSVRGINIEGLKSEGRATCMVRASPATRDFCWQNYIINRLPAGLAMLAARHVSPANASRFVRIPNKREHSVDLLLYAVLDSFADSEPGHKETCR
jgi:hypothetical protein